MLDEVDWLLKHHSLAYFVPRGISLGTRWTMIVCIEKVKVILRDDETPVYMLAQALEEYHIPSWWHLSSSAQQPCEPPFFSPGTTGSASSRCRSRRPCSARPDHSCWYLFFFSLLIVVDICALISSWIQSRLSEKPLKTHLGSCCTSEVSGLSHFEASGVPMSTITHAVLRPPPLAALPSSSFWPQLWVLRISCRALPQLCLVKSSLQVITWSWNNLENNFWKLALFLWPFRVKYPFAQFSILLVHIQGKVIQQKYFSVVNTANDRLYWISS